MVFIIQGDNQHYSTKIKLGLATGANYAFIIDEEKKKAFIRSNPKNEEIIKPILRGRDIFRYVYKKPNLYILLTKNGIDIQNEYPDIYNYLNSFDNTFKKRGAKGRHWTNLRACSFFNDFKKEKLIWIELTDKGTYLCTFTRATFHCGFNRTIMISRSKDGLNWSEPEVVSPPRNEKYKAWKMPKLIRNEQDCSKIQQFEDGHLEISVALSDVFGKNCY